MRKLFIALTSAALFQSNLLQAENSDPAPLPLTYSTPFDAGVQPSIRLWANFDYLYLWTKNVSLPVPIATSGNSADIRPAALGQPGTQVLFGNNSIHNGASSGFRVALRSWVDKNNDYALEASALYLPSKTTSAFSVQSSTVLGVPFNDVAPFPLPPDHGGWMNVGPGETAILLGFESFGSTGSITVDSSTQLWGVELNGLFHFLSLPTFRLSALGGFNYTHLQDQLEISYTSDLNPRRPFHTAYLQDRFKTDNGVYTGQVGLRGEWSHKRVFTSFIVKLGLGGVLQTTHIKGSFSDPVPNLYLNYGIGQTGGIFSQTTNSGKKRQSRFAITPAATIRLGFNLCSNLRLYAGYDILFLNSVLRPGEQIDRSINETQAGSVGGLKPVLSGPKRPKPLMQTSTYWAQGINAGLEVRF